MMNVFSTLAVALLTTITALISLLINSILTLHKERNQFKLQKQQLIRSQYPELRKHLITIYIYWNKICNNPIFTEYLKGSIDVKNFYFENNTLRSNIPDKYRIYSADFFNDTKMLIDNLNILNTYLANNYILNFYKRKTRVKIVDLYTFCSSFVLASDCSEQILREKIIPNYDFNAIGSLITELDNAYQKL